MKLTKTKLKQLIKETLEGEFGEDTPEWVREMEDVMKDAHELYERMPEEGKRHFIENFEMYAKKWKEELEGTEEGGEEKRKEDPSRVPPGFRLGKSTLIGDRW